MTRSFASSDLPSRKPAASPRPSSSPSASRSCAPAASPTAPKPSDAASPPRTQPCLSPINPEILRAGPHHCLATCLSNLGQPESALQALENSLRDDPKSRAARIDLGRLLFAQGRPIDALNHLHELVAASPTDADAWRLGGDIALSRPDFLEFAVNWTTEAVKNLPTDPGLANQHGEALLRSGNAENALASWQTAAAQGGNSQRAALCLCAVAAGHPAPIIETESEPAVKPRILKALPAAHRHARRIAPAEGQRQPPRRRLRPALGRAKNRVRP